LTILSSLNWFLNWNDRSVIFIVIEQIVSLPLSFLCNTRNGRRAKQRFFCNRFSIDRIHRCVIRFKQTATRFRLSLKSRSITRLGKKRVVRILIGRRTGLSLSRSCIGILLSLNGLSKDFLLLFSKFFTTLKSFLDLLRNTLGRDGGFNRRCHDLTVGKDRTVSKAKAGGRWNISKIAGGGCRDVCNIIFYFLFDSTFGCCNSLLILF